jgi:hypothetical protein
VSIAPTMYETVPSLQLNSLFNCRLGTVSYMVGVMLTVVDPTVSKSTEVKITVQL